MTLVAQAQSATIGSRATTTSYTSDAYGQQASTTAGSSTQNYTYDALGRLTSEAGPSALTFTYAGDTSQIASDGHWNYTYTPGGTLAAAGPAGGGTSAGRLTLTDAHTDVTGDFTPSGATLAGSASYDPYGNLLASATLAGNLGYQSGFTDPATKFVHMGARWYNPAASQFTSRDTININPVPDPAAAGPFAYTGDDPLTGTDPTGHYLSGLTGPRGAWHPSRYTHAWTPPYYPPPPYNPRTDLARLKTRIGGRIHISTSHPNDVHKIPPTQIGYGIACHKLGLCGGPASINDPSFRQQPCNPPIPGCPGYHRPVTWWGTPIRATATNAGLQSGRWPVAGSPGLARSCALTEIACIPTWGGIFSFGTTGTQAPPEAPPTGGGISGGRGDLGSLIASSIGGLAALLDALSRLTPKPTKARQGQSRGCFSSSGPYDYGNLSFSNGASRGRATFAEACIAPDVKPVGGGTPYFPDLFPV